MLNVIDKTIKVAKTILNKYQIEIFKLYVSEFYL